MPAERLQPPVEPIDGGESVRRRHPRSRIIAVFEPVFGATIRTWGWRYARALRLADVPIVLPTIEHPDYPSTSDPALRDWYLACGDHVLPAASQAEAASLAADRARPGDVVVGFVQMNRRGTDLAAALIAALDAPA